MLIRGSLPFMPKTTRQLAEDMVRSILREYNGTSNVRVSTDAGPGFVMLDYDAEAATDRAMKAGVIWLLRYETDRIMEAGDGKKTA